MSAFEGFSDLPLIYTDDQVGTSVPEILTIDTPGSQGVHRLFMWGHFYTSRWSSDQPPH